MKYYFSTYFQRANNEHKSEIQELGGRPTFFMT